MARMIAPSTQPFLAMGRCLFHLARGRLRSAAPHGHRSHRLVADVRLDNRDELELRPLQNRSAAWPTAICWQRHGSNGAKQYVNHLSGAFSFAVWKEQEQHLFLARDHTGERPLFYASTANGFAFASMPKGLHPLPFVGRRSMRITSPAISRSVTCPRAHDLSQYAPSTRGLLAECAP